MVRRVGRWQPSGGYRKVAGIPREFRTGTVHTGEVVKLKTQGFRVMGALVDFGAPRYGFIHEAQAQGLEIGTRVEIRVDRAGDYKGKPNFDLVLLKVLLEEKPQPAKPADPWAGFKRKGDWIIFPADKAGDGLPGIYHKRFAAITTKVENSGEETVVFGQPHHIMVPQGFTDAMESIYGQEFFTLQLMKEDGKRRDAIYYYVCHPDLPDIFLGKVEVAKLFEPRVGKRVALRFPSLNNNNQDFAAFLEDMSDSEFNQFQHVVLYTGTINTIGARNAIMFYAPPGKPLGHSSIRIPACLLWGKVSCEPIDVVIIGRDREGLLSTNVIAYPANYKTAVEKLKAMFEGAEAELEIMSNHYFMHGGPDYNPKGYMVNVDYDGMTFGGFLVSPEKLFMMGDKLTQRIKFGPEIIFIDDIGLLTERLLKDLTFELI